MHWQEMAWWAWVPLSIGMLLFWGLLAWLALRLLSGRGSDPAASEPSARQILDARFARGEIGAGEYEHARRLLLGLAESRADEANLTPSSVRRGAA